MKKALRVTGRIFLWLVYLLLTGKERQKYQHAKYRGREVLSVENDLFGSTYTLGRRLRSNEEPERNFLTWKEYRKVHNF